MTEAVVSSLLISFFFILQIKIILPELTSLSSQSKIKKQYHLFDPNIYFSSLNLIPKPFWTQIADWTIKFSNPANKYVWR